jgi:hypothetical protein
LQTPHNNVVYTPEPLGMIRRVHESFNIATGNGPVRSGWQDNVRIRLEQVIMSGVAKGVKDPLALRRMALTAVAMGYLDNSAD